MMARGTKRIRPVRSQSKEEAPFVALDGRPVARVAIASEVGAPRQAPVVFELRQRDTLPRHLRGLPHQSADPLAVPKQLPCETRRQPGGDPLTHVVLVVASAGLGKGADRNEEHLA